MENVYKSVIKYFLCDMGPWWYDTRTDMSVNVATTIYNAHFLLSIRSLDKSAMAKGKRNYRPSPSLFNTCFT